MSKLPHSEKEQLSPTFIAILIVVAVIVLLLALLLFTGVKT